MKRSTIRTVILLAIVALIGVVIAQYYWVSTAIEIQENQFELSSGQAALEEKQFNTSVSIALTNVAEEILTINRDSADLYDAVKQLRSNYFTVSINDTVHPYLLESLLKKEFNRRNITENFEYGIYDCFTDSVVYGNYVSMTEANDSSIAERPQIRWDKDGHYFGVYFPNRKSYSIEEPQTTYTTWALTSVIILIVLTFLGYAIFVMVKQKRLSEVTTDFINNMTHELKTPISTIQLSSETLLKPGVEEDPERMRQYISIIYNENTRLKNQVERVLQLAKLDTGKVKLKREQIDVHQLLTRQSQNMQLTAEEKGGSISLALNATQPSLNADRVHLQNIMNNLMDNAIKYSEGKPEVNITTANVGNDLEIRVQDRGIGMSRESLKNIFEKFFRVSTGNVHDVKGFGLGLYYVKVIVEEHGGSIRAESEINQGSTFIVRLPSTPNQNTST